MQLDFKKALAKTLAGIDSADGVAEQFVDYMARVFNPPSRG
jgi:hypothetical protein